MRQLNRRKRAFRFSLRTFLLAAVVAAGLIAVLDRSVTRRARFEIKESYLKVDGGFVNGVIYYRCSQLNSWNNIEYSDSHLYVKNLADTRMVDIKVGDEFFVRYRNWGFWPLKKENQYLIFMQRELGIDEGEVEGFVHMDGWTEVHVKGASSDDGE